MYPTLFLINVTGNTHIILFGRTVLKLYRKCSQRINTIIQQTFVKR
jgi:hypothetical protein